VKLKCVLLNGIRRQLRGVLCCWATRSSPQLQRTHSAPSPTVVCCLCLVCLLCYLLISLPLLSPQRTRRFEGSGIAYAKGAYWVVFDSLKWGARTVP
jgi:hypothetical protein